MADEDPLLDMRQSADYIDVEYHSLRIYLARARKNHEDGNPRPGDIPLPDKIVGRSPAWYKSTWDRWLPTRPGQGTGGGRPRKEASGN